MDKIRGPGFRKLCLTLLVVLGILFSAVLIVRADVDGKSYIRKEVQIP